MSDEIREIMGMMDEDLYQDCETAEQVVGRWIYLEGLKEKDLADEKFAYDNYWIDKLMRHYNMPYSAASREFYSYGLTRMGAVI